MSDTTQFVTLLVDIEGGVATVWLNQPEQRNVFDLVMIDELHRALSLLESDEAVRAIVVTGSGRYFSAGADLSSGVLPRDASPVGEDGSDGPRWIRPWQMRTPVIAAINGPAVGIGLTLPLTWVGLSRCMDVLLSGELFTGDEALARGTVIKTFDAADVCRPHCHSLTTSPTTRPPLQWP